MKKKGIIILSLTTILISLSIIFVFKPSKKNSCDGPKISEIKISTTADTLSYSLGMVWSKNMSRAGLNRISYAFYRGVQDFIKKDTSIMGLYKAMDILEKDTNLIHATTNPLIDSNTLVCEIKLDSRFDTFSYALGFAWIQGAYKAGISEVTPAIISGLFDGFKNDTTIINFSSAEVYLNKFVEGLRLNTYGSSKKTNDEWLVNNAKNPGVISLPSGVQYKILKKGKGKLITPDQVIEAHYAARLIDGTIYETSPEQPLKFFITAVIPGLAEAILKMHVGDSCEIYIPSQLAYGSGGIKGKVPPYSTVIYTIEIVRTSHLN